MSQRVTESGAPCPVLISIRPQWAALIASGAKTIELRRQPSGCGPGTPLVIYTSFPVKRVTATAIVKAVHVSAPAELFDAVGAAACVTRPALVAYLSDLDLGYAIELSDVRVLAAPLVLGRSGPQSFRYLLADRSEDAALLRAIAAAS